MRRLVILIITSVILSLFLLEPAIAGNKFETISGGVSGFDDKKIAQLKSLVPYAGGFLVFLGAITILTRNHFEGMVLVNKRSRISSSVIIGLLLMLLGGLLVWKFL